MTKYIVGSLSAGVLIVGAYAIGVFQTTRVYEQRLKDQRDICAETLELSNVSLRLAQQSLDYALKYQDTLDACLTWFPGGPRGTPARTMERTAYTFNH